jgi:hypothetical protein
MLAPVSDMQRGRATHPQNQKDAAAALHIMSDKVSSLSPDVPVPLPPTPEAYLAGRCTLTPC